VPIFSKLNNKRRKPLEILPNEFKEELKVKNNITDLKTIPILMFKGKLSQIHHVIIVKVGNDNIGVSLAYNVKMKMWQVTGIHIDEESIYNQHRLVSLKHNDTCKCFDNFQTNIDHLMIGNIDNKENTLCNLRNTVNDLKKRNKGLSDDNQSLLYELESYRDVSITPSVSRSSSTDYKHGILSDAYDSSSTN